MAIWHFKRGLRLSDFTTFRIGGEAALLAQVSSAAELKEAAARAISSGVAWRVLGHGSNILAADEGVDSAIIIFRSSERPLILSDAEITVSGGYPLAELVIHLASQGLGGFEKLAGIPGTVGGAISGNAGAYGACIGDCIRRVRLLDQNGHVREVHNPDLKFGYRHSALKETHEAVLEATIEAHACDKRALLAQIEARLAHRRAKHPDLHTVPTAGSYFKNVCAGDGSMTAAGRLLDEAGCGQMRVGGAHTWHKHANIIVTDGNASASDVLKLAKKMEDRVAELFGIRLIPEVGYIGKGGNMFNSGPYSIVPDTAS